MIVHCALETFSRMRISQTFSTDRIAVEASSQNVHSAVTRELGADFLCLVVQLSPVAHHERRNASASGTKLRNATNCSRDLTRNASEQMIGPMDSLNLRDVLPIGSRTRIINGAAGIAVPRVSAPNSWAIGFTGRRVPRLRRPATAWANERRLMATHRRPASSCRH